MIKDEKAFQFSSGSGTGIFLSNGTQLNNYVPCSYVENKNIKQQATASSSERPEQT